MKKKIKHAKSILQTKDGRCFLCMLLNDDYRKYKYIHEHHVFNGPNRKLSEELGLKVYLCVEHHVVGPEAVHNNRENMLNLKRIGQDAYERNHTREEFIDTFGRSYL